MPDATVTRSHNVGLANKTGETRRNVFSRTPDEIQEQTKTVEMGISNADAIFEMLSDLSATPGAYVLREAYSNAYDATMRANTDSPIEIELDPLESATGIAAKLYGTRTESRTLVVRDYGCGMSPEMVSDIYLQYGGSDKVGEADSVGSKGLGAKAPLAIAADFDVVSVCDNVRTTCHVTRASSGPNTATVRSEATDEPNGTRVIIPVEDTDHLRQMWDFVDRLANFHADIPVTVNGHALENALPTTRGQVGAGYVFVGEIEMPTNPPTKMRTWQSYSPYYDYGQFPRKSRGTSKRIQALVAGVPYALCENDTSTHPAYLVEVEPGWLDFTPSRDEVKQTPATHAFVNALNQGIESHPMTLTMEDHILNCDAATLATIRAEVGVIGEAPVRNSRASGNLHIEKMWDGRWQLYCDNQPLDISDAAMQRILDAQAPLDVLCIFHPNNSSKLSLELNGMKRSDYAIASVLGRTRPHCVAEAFAATSQNTHPDDDNERVIVIECQDVAEAAWVVNNATWLAHQDLVPSPKDDGKYHYGRSSSSRYRDAYLFLAIGDVTIDGLFADLYKSIRHVSVSHLKSEAAKIRADVRAEAKARREKRKADEKANGATHASTEWLESIGSVAAFHRDMPAEELLLHVASAHGRCPDKVAASQKQVLRYVVDDARKLAIVMSDEGTECSDDPTSLALALRFANDAEPGIVPDTVTHVAILSAKSVSARAVNALVRDGAFVVADFRTKLKSVVSDTLVSRRPDLISMTYGSGRYSRSRVKVPMAQTIDESLFARILLFWQLFLWEDNRADWSREMAKLACNIIDPSLLKPGVRETFELAKDTLSDFVPKDGSHCTYYNHVNRSDETQVFTLCGSSVTSAMTRTTFNRLPLIPTHVPDATIARIEAAGHVARWAKGLSEELGLSSFSRFTDIPKRMMAFAPMLAYDMNEYLLKEDDQQ